MRFIRNAAVLAGAILIVWIMASWVDILLHNDPITGNKEYWAYNAFVLITGQGEEK